jgi:hypothetical protein
MSLIVDQALLRTGFFVVILAEHEAFTGTADYFKKFQYFAKHASAFDDGIVRVWTAWLGT